MTWLGKHVETHYATEPKGKRDAGQVVAYSDEPMVCIRTNSGDVIWWNASLTRIVDCDCVCHRDES